ncbi:uncharacterized protein LOC131243042 [Magnolia sinica]|uniref:uncharacterized protein LOC131243042 n=1 Tax=Magnolia sinica TaxID=86752 RepID=UPI00265ACC84|nr:uncharacterized protein LOC131243042 [Magnolia sinica]
MIFSTNMLNHGSNKWTSLSIMFKETSKMILLRGQLRVQILAAQMSASSPVVGRHLEISCYVMPARSSPFLKNQLLKRVFALENCKWSRPILPNLQICFNLVFRVSFQDKSPGIKDPKGNAEDNCGDDFQNNEKESTTKMRSDLLQFRAAQVILSSDFTNLMDPEHRGELPPDSFSASSNAFPGYVYNVISPR